MRVSSGAGGGFRTSDRLRPGSRTERKTVLVVEDDVDFRELLVDHLVACGRTVRTAGNGAEALAVLADTGVDVGILLLDLRMPVMDGFELCQRLERQGKRVPIVVMTAEHETRRVERFPWVVAVLHKPLDVVRLDGLIDATARV
jgi:CheY-like chemotaxis protein